MLKLFNSLTWGIIANQVFLNEQLSKLYNFKNVFRLSSFLMYKYFKTFQDFSKKISFKCVFLKKKKNRVTLHHIHTDKGVL